MRRCAQFAMNRLASFRRDERGYAVMATLAIFLFLFVLCAAVYAVGETIHERIKIQNACDAAAYSAAAVQADGLSRMACVNRAMSWTYVQMSNRQMDYITYRWLWLTCKRFVEDRKNAEKYADQMILVADRELGFFAILEAAISGALDALLKTFGLDLPCDTGDHRPSQTNGRPWWAGQSGRNEQKNIISLNKLPAVPRVTTHDNLNSVRTVLAEIFDIGGPDGSANLLGRLIDYDKINIEQMNKALSRINYEMTRSMRETAENVLKASLVDSRRAPQDSLSDYYVTISIPYARNPYSSEGSATNMSVSVSSYFSPLRNTEPDERRFLQFQNGVKDLGAEPLSALFPTFGFGNSSTAFGIDQWFMRGKGVYDGEETDSIVGTVRDEGTLGIQRVYKDTDLNESGAGVEALDHFVLHKVFRGNHLVNVTELARSAVQGGVAAFNRFISGGGELSSPDDDVDEDTDEDDGTVDDSSSNEEIRARLERQKAELERELEEVDSRRAETGAELNELRRRLAAAETEEEREELNGQITYKQAAFNGYTARITQINADIREINDSLSNIGNTPSPSTSQPGGGDDGGGAGENHYGDSSPGSGLGSFFSSLFSTVLESFMSFLGDKIIEIQPSCTHVHGGEDFVPPMCEAAHETTGLVSQYRWASCKWYCMTTLKAYLYSLIWNHQKIYCDRSTKVFKKIGHGRLAIKFKAHGNGHFSFPKWFCARKPDQPLETGIPPLDRVLHMFPPFPVPIAFVTNYNVTVSHGYMKTPFDLEGFIEPMKALASKDGFHRDEYNSCAQFFDGNFTFSPGRDSYAGLIQGHARIYGDDKEIFDSRYVGARCKPWILNEKFFSGEGTIVVGAARKFYNPFSTLIGFLGNEKAIADYDKSVLSAFKIPKDNYMWTMSAARAGVRHRRRNGKFDKERMYQVTYDPTPDTATLHYHDARPVLYDHQDAKWRPVDNVLKTEDGLSEEYGKPLIWDGCVCRRENAGRFRDIWNLCESDWDATLLPLRYSCVGADLHLESAARDERQKFMEQTIRERRQMVDYAYGRRKNEEDEEDDIIGAGTNWVWNATGGMQSLDTSVNPFTGSWWKRATESYFNVLDTGWQHSLHFLPAASKLPDDSGDDALIRYWNMLQQNRIL